MHARRCSSAERCRQDHPAGSDSFLAPGRGLRRARMQDVTRSDAPVDESPGALRWAVASTLGSVGGAIEVGTGFASGGDGDDGGRRVVRINGINTRSQSALSEILAVVWLVPDMDRLFMDSAGRRRRFLDRTAFDPAHTTRLNEYEQAMRERTAAA